MGRRPAAERMAATGTGGDGNGVPTTPDHGGAAAEGRQDLGKLLERLGREIGDRSGENTTPERRGMVGLTGDREIPRSGGFPAMNNGDRGAARRCEARVPTTRSCIRNIALGIDLQGGNGNPLDSYGRWDLLANGLSSGDLQMGLRIGAIRGALLRRRWHTAGGVVWWRWLGMHGGRVVAVVEWGNGAEAGVELGTALPTAQAAREVKRQLKPRSPEKKIPIDPSVKNFFKGMSTTNKDALKISDYDRTLQKAHHKKSKPVSQLGEQPNQEVEPLVTGEDFGITDFISDTGVTMDQLIGGTPIPKAEVAYKFELGKSLMYKFYERYMEMSAKGRELFGARIRNPDFLQGEDVLWIHFKDLFDLYHLDALDVSLLSAWILVTVYDSMNKEEKIFDKVFQLIDRAWDRFRQLVRGTWKEKLGQRFHFPRIHMRDNLPHKDFIMAVQEQLMGFINEEVLNPDGEFYYDGSTIHNVGPSSSDITPASKS
uniref:Transposon protein, putative, CACTA, En/Spm sub-class n=2 Tax=Oryza sativa subsp. japonica TaxID=39947 RepID=Q53KI6_ORYSJ|nr:transposon protein, putative, CACTA, En/Spm sub-class [Oryza sativa Japonica Group]ABA93323.1 transposon protein, putative, CACTA, En/Spm sub-class [Oryza sativa Japonica Group]